MEENKLITGLAIRFVEEHWDEINLTKAQINHKQHEFIEIIKTDYNIACWIISEVMSWGCNKNYLRQYIIEGDSDEHIIKVEDTYFRMSDNYNYNYVKVEPKFKTVVYFE